MPIWLNRFKRKPQAHPGEVKLLPIEPPKFETLSDSGKSGRWPIVGLAVLLGYAGFQMWAYVTTGSPTLPPQHFQVPEPAPIPDVDLSNVKPVPPKETHYEKENECGTGRHHVRAYTTKRGVHVSAHCSDNPKRSHHKKNDD